MDLSGGIHTLVQPGIIAQPMAYHDAVTHRALLAACLFLYGCSDDPPPNEPAPLADPLTFPVGEPGPFHAGYRTFDTTYDAPDGERAIKLNIWYPTSDTEGETPTYLAADPAVFQDAALLRSAYEAGYPVLVHSHGYQGFGANSEDLMRHFATHGWIAVAPDHKGNLTLDTVEPLPTAHYFHRPLDLRAALDALEQHAELAGKVDLSRVAMSGHSFGTYTAWAVAGAAYDPAAIQAACDAGDLPTCTADELAAFATDLSEPRIRVAIPMAGGARDTFFGASGYDAVAIPMLLMTGSDDDVGAQALFDLVNADLTWIDIAGGCHQLFGFGGCGAISDDEGFPIVNSYALAFARRYALDDDDPEIAAIVAGDTVPDPVTYTSK